MCMYMCFFSLHHLSFEAPRRRLDLPVLASSRPRVRSTHVFLFGGGGANYFELVRDICFAAQQ